MVLGVLLLIQLQGLLDIGEQLVLLFLLGLLDVLVLFFLLLGVLLVLFFCLFLRFFLLFLLLFQCCRTVELAVN